MRALEGKTIVLGVTGGIAAYKAADLASKLVQAGAQVYVVMTPSAQEFVSPLTFEALTGQPVTTDIFDQSEFSIQHVALAELADAVVVAPATANNIARIASGLADDMVCLTVLATRAPVVIAPAMDEGMFQARVTQGNLKKLEERGLVIIGPAHGHLASGKEGWGRMEEVEKIIGTLRWALGRGGDLAGKKIVVTAGGTQEPLDPVRVLSNKSSGKMGYALAEAARDRGAQVVLVSAPTAIAPPVAVELVPVNTAQEMKEAVEKAVKDAQALLMAAAVADYRPEKYAGQKLKRGQALTLSLELERTPDILGEVKGDFLRVGFALETENLVRNARKKLKEKALDLVVANDVSAFAQDQSQVVLIDKSGKAQKLPLLPKLEIAHRVLDRMIEYWKAPTPPARPVMSITYKGQLAWRKGYIHVGDVGKARAFFPGHRVRFMLQTGKVPIEGLRVLYLKDRRAEIHGLKPWYDAHPDLRAGDRLVFEVLEPKVRYRLSIQKA